MRIPIISAIKCFATHLKVHITNFKFQIKKNYRSRITMYISRYADLAQVRLLPRMYAHMLLKMFGIDKRCGTYFAFIWSFACMRCFYMIIQQSSPLKSFPTIVTFISFVIIMRCSFVRLKI